MERKEFLKLGSITAAGFTLLPKRSLLASTGSTYTARTVPTSYVDSHIIYN